MCNMGQIKRDRPQILLQIITSDVNMTSRTHNNKRLYLKILSKNRGVPSYGLDFM